MVRLALLAVLLSLATCGRPDEPFSYTDRKEMSDRPGLFTGRSGSVVLFHE